MTEGTSPTVLAGALLVDGTGAAPFRGDVEVTGGRITAVGDLDHDRDAAVVDLDGLVLAPGFIDVHTHLDAQAFWDPSFTPSTWHGVTSAVLGNCGFGIAPTRTEDRDAVMETLEHVEGMSLASLRAGLSWGFETFPEFLDALDRLPKRLNIGAYLGHTPLRIYVMGFEAATSRHATEAERATMRRLVAEALAAGALGLSTSQAPNHFGAKGLPVPSRVAAREELLELFSVVADAGRGVVATTLGPDLALAEVAKLSRAGGFRATWGALFTGMFGPTGTALAMLEEAAEVGGDVWPQVSCRPIVVQISFEEPAFLGLAPAFGEVFALARGEREPLYRDESWRARAREQLLGYRPGIYAQSSVDETEIHRELIGIPIETLAAAQGVHPLDVMLDLSLAEGLRTRFKYVVHNNDPVELPKLLADPRTILGAHDAGAHVDILCDACFPTHLLGYWVREQGALSLEQAVFKLTGQPAAVFGLAGRGTIATGNWADLVAFDPRTVAAAPLERRFDFPADGERLVSEARGIEAVFVNGTVTRLGGQDVEEARPGALLE